MSDVQTQRDEEVFEARMQESVARAGRTLHDEEIALLRSGIRDLMAAARELRAVPLANHDEPEIVFDAGRVNAPSGHENQS